MDSLFAILGLPASFNLSLKALEDAYFTAQGACHPDRFVGKPEAECLAAISRSQLVNDAYETLKNPLRRAEHLLELQGIFVLDDGAQPPQTLLMEMMELREGLSEAADSGVELAIMVEKIKTLAQETIDALGEAFAQGDYTSAAEETQRLNYLGKAMEEAYMTIHRLKASVG